MKTTFFFACLFAGCISHAQKAPRTFENLDEGWQFIEGDTAGQQWQPVCLPHTWNRDDVMDDVPGYYRGVGWYKKHFRVAAGKRGQDVSLYFEGANQQSEIYVNGRRAGAHDGGYSGFRIPISSLLRFGGDNELLVKVDNSYNKNLAPLSADFSFYGGIYRDVFLVTTGAVHFSDSAFGSEGVYVSTPEVSARKARVQVKSLVFNPYSYAQPVIITSVIYDREGKKVSAVSSKAELLPGMETAVHQEVAAVAGPRLWSPEEPYLYTVETRIRNAKGEVLDEVRNKIGFRWFGFDADKGFLLNGASCKLIGASRHQDYQGLGNAVPDSLAVRDVVLLKNMGANFMRIAHYPQDPCVLKACDSLGLLASVEIPVVNEITESDTFYSNCERMQTEMIRQNFNHPSIILWCYMNEVLLRPHFVNDKERQKLYYASVTALAQRLENLTRREDPYRYTLMADHGNLAQYRNAGLLQIPMVIGWNLYSGWYGGSMEEFPQFLDDFHAAYPTKPFMVTEYGADADPRIRNANPVRFDKSVEYTTRFHQYYFTGMMQRPYVAGAVIWNLADFNSETRTETMPHINNKGLLQWDRTPKDPYYFYQAELSKKPFIKILGSCQGKFGLADSSRAACYQQVQVAANLDSITLSINGKAQPAQAVKDGLCEWKLPFKEGVNTVLAEGRTGGHLYSDSISTYLQLQPPCLTDMAHPFKQINILLGSTRCFTDEKGAWWQPGQPYSKGGWGSVGGTRFHIPGNNRLPYGTDKNILGTDDDPVYQTQLTGIRQYRLDIPAGTYELTLCFAELLGGTVNVPPYNLAGDERSEKLLHRIFNVKVNGRSFLDHFNIADTYGLAQAVQQSTTVTVKEEQGIVIDFEPVEGEPVLNAVQLKRLDTK